MSTDLRLVVDRARSLGYAIPTANTLYALDTFVTSLKNLSVWNACDYIRVSAYNNTALQNFALINLRNPTGSLAFTVGGMLYQTQGFRGTKTAGTYLNSGINLSTTTNYTQNSATRMYVLYQATTNGIAQGIDGVLGFSTENQISNNSGSAQKINQGTGNMNVSADMTGTGSLAIVRTSSTSVFTYNKGTQTIGTVNSAARVNANQLENTTFNVPGDAGISFSLYGSALTVTQLDGIRSSFNTYLTAIGLTPFA